MKFAAVFNGRRKGAIGKIGRQRTIVQGASEKAAYVALYERFDHISNVQLTPLGAGDRKPAGGLLASFSKLLGGRRRGGKVGRNASGRFTRAR